MPDWCRPWGNGYITTRSLTHLAPPQVVVPEEFPFNVSVPRWLRWLVDPHDKRLLQAACFHDYAIHRLGWSRPLSAALWNEVLRDGEHFSLAWRAVLFIALSLWKFD